MALFASGSPFGLHTHKGKTYRPAQGNNAYVFPGIGLGAVACRARTLPDELFLEAARTLASLVSQDDLDRGALYPPLADIRKISLEIAVSVARKAHDRGLARAKRPRDLRKSIEKMMYRP
jgi:malate dehydrogenase (oxaloacetate-decarboxylating)(NADP+)